MKILWCLLSLLLPNAATGSVYQATLKLTQINEVYGDDQARVPLQQDFSLYCPQLGQGFVPARATSLIRSASVVYSDNFRGSLVEYLIGTGFTTIETKSKLDLGGLDVNAGEVATDLGSIGCSPFNSSAASSINDVLLGLRKAIRYRSASLDLGLILLIPPNQTSQTLDEKRSPSVSILTEPGVGFGRILVSVPIDILMTKAKIDRTMSIRAAISEIPLADAEGSLSASITNQTKDVYASSNFSNHFELRVDFLFISGVFASLISTIPIAGRNAIVERSLELSLGTVK